MKKFCKLLLLFIVIGCIVFSTQSFITNANTGTDCTMGGITTRQTKAFILETFGLAEDAEALANALLDFALGHFVYDERYVSYPQVTDTNRFIFKNDFHGVCMDFAAFVKSVFQVVGHHNGWNNVGCNVVIGLDFFGKKGHAVNYITVKDSNGSTKIYELDTTWDLDRQLSGRPLHRLSKSVTVAAADSIPDTIRSMFVDYYGLNPCIIT